MKKPPVNHTAEEIVERFETQVKLLPEKVQTAALKMLDTEFGTAFYSAPASTRQDYHNAYAGGLVDHSLTVTETLLNLLHSFPDPKISADSLRFLGLFHDLGKAGDGENEYYLKNNSHWHQERGIFYEINEQCLPMTISDRTLYLVNYLDLKVLTPEEFLALRLVEADPAEIPHFYRFKEPKISLWLNFANNLAISHAKNQ